MKLNKIIILLGVSCIGFLSFVNNNTQNNYIVNDNLSSDSTKTNKNKKVQANGNKIQFAGNYNAMIGGCNSNNLGGVINKNDFLNIINNPLCGIDEKTKKNYPITNFDMTYCEKQESEDSTGLPIIVTDYTMEPIEGDAIPEKWKKVFNDRLYKGDTIKIENIRLRNGIGKYKCKNKIIVVITE